MENSSSEKFFKDERLPFIECRYTKNSGKHYKPHMHRTFSIGAIDDGEVEYSVDSYFARLKKGSLAIINPDTLHSCNPLKSCERSYYMLYLDTSWCATLQNSDIFISTQSILLEDERLYESYIKTMDFFMSDGYLIEKEQMMITLLESIFSKINSTKKFIDKKDSLPVRELKQILLENFDEDITVNEVAKSLQVNSYTLLRNFKDEVGITPHTFRLNARIEQAKKLLSAKIDISEVAQECGFFDQSHFHRNFKAITTVTPREYQLNFIQ